jgi:DNA-binding transcriptional LysR family regulator
MFDWDDLKPFLAVARHGSTIAAARALQVDQSTVQRRITELERRVGQPLVERRASGYRLTAYGEELRPLAEAVEQQVAALEQRIRDTGRELNGIVRLTCPEPLVQRITQSPLLDRLHAVHPRLRIEFVTSDRYLDLAKGDADVALRSGDTVDGSLVGRKVADSLWAVYASRAGVCLACVRGAGGCTGWHRRGFDASVDRTRCLHGRPSFAAMAAAGGAGRNGERHQHERAGPRALRESGRGDRCPAHRAG